MPALETPRPPDAALLVSSGAARARPGRDAGASESGGGGLGIRGGGGLCRARGQPPHADPSSLAERSSAPTPPLVALPLPSPPPPLRPASSPSARGRPALPPACPRARPAAAGAAALPFAVRPPPSLSLRLWIRLQRRARAGGAAFSCSAPSLSFRGRLAVACSVSLRGSPTAPLRRWARRSGISAGCGSRCIFFRAFVLFFLRGSFARAPACGCAFPCASPWCRLRPLLPPPVGRVWFLPGVLRPFRRRLRRGFPRTWSFSVRAWCAVRT